ncbi:MAG: phosphatase PAP2 family protein [Thermoplasmata archaeon]|nr:phosphatase PAP2 family protein [Thermoplasmata archaeon]
MGKEHDLTGKDLLFILILNIAVLFIGGGLILAGNNESLYSDNELIFNLFSVITELGNEKLYVIAATMLYLGYDKGFARRMFILFFATVFSTVFLKQLFHDPRPPANRLLGEQISGYGLPSGHTTTSLVFYGYPLLARLEGSRGLKRVLFTFCIFAVVAVPVSRIVIGVHDLQDVLGGYIVGIIMIITFMWAYPKVASRISSFETWRKVSFGVLVTGLLFLSGLTVLTALYPGEFHTSVEELGMGAGLLLGCAIAFPLEDRYVGYEPKGVPLPRRMVLMVVGLLLSMVIYGAASYLSGLLLPSYMEGVAVFCVLILGVSLVSPWVLVRLNSLSILDRISDRKI